MNDSLFFLYTPQHFLKMLMDSNKHLSADESALIPAQKVTEMSNSGISTWKLFPC